MNTENHEEIFDAFVATLNEAYKSDAPAMHALIYNRVPCNDLLANHPWIPVDCNLVAAGESHAVGMLGVINGICDRLTGRKVAVMFSDPPDEYDRRRIEGFTEFKPIDQPWVISTTSSAT